MVKARTPTHRSTLLPVALATRSEGVDEARALLVRWRRGCIVRARVAEREARTQESWAGLALAGTEYPHVMLACRHGAEARRYRDQAGVIDDMLAKLPKLEGRGVVIMDEFLRWVESDDGNSDMEASVLKLSAGMKPLIEELDLDGPEPEVARAAVPQAKLSDLQRAVAATEADPQVSALLGAKGAAERRERALASPELKPPHPYFSHLVNDVLTFVYFEGLSYEETAERVGISPSAVAGMATRALRFLALYRQDPELSDRRASQLLDPLRSFEQARNAAERRYAARRHPEVRELFGKLCEREAAVLDGLYWEGKTLQEVGQGLGLTKERVRQLGNKALRKLSYSFKLEQRREADQARVDEVRQALRDTDTLEQAARALSLTPLELLTYLGRMDLPLSDAPSLVDDWRVKALRAARTAPTRLRVAGLYPELRPPHVFLSEDENRVLEGLYWRGQTYQEAKGVDAWSYWGSVAQLKELEVSALDKLAFYLRHNDLSYYRLEE